MEVLKTVNMTIGVLFIVCYSYQLLYIPVSWLIRRNRSSPPSVMDHSYAVLICARNEAAVIQDLIDSLHRQTYCAEKLRIFVLADNCTDKTALLARKKGATVYERFDLTHVGKGYALSCLLNHLEQDYPQGFDGFFVFDADNVLNEDYIEQMDRVFSQGHEIVTSYRNSKNYGDNWISAGYALWFLRESRYLNQARFLLDSSCAVSGTGFLFSRAVARELCGWPFHLLTEDIEFSVFQITHGHKIAFCADAILYDEQPVTFSQSWRQRMRWSRGYLQVVRHYGSELIFGTLRGSFSCFDMAMTIMPAFILTLLSLFCNVVLGIWGAGRGDNPLAALQSVGHLLFGMYLTLFIIGAITTITEWNQIHTTALKKLFYAFTFPIFMLTYIPISFASLFVDPGWKPIQHSVSFDPYCVTQHLQRNPDDTEVA